MEEKNFLGNKKVTVKFVGRKGGLNNSPGHVLEGGKMAGTYSRFPAPMNATGTIKDFLSKEEKEFFSKAIGVDLDVRNREFWDDFGITLTKEDMTLDLSDPMQMLQFKALHHYPAKICTKPENLSQRATYQWCLYNTDDESLSKKNELDTQMRAFMNFGRIQHSRDILSYLYKNIEGRLVSRETTMADLIAKFSDILKTKFVRFNLLVEDPLLDEKVILNTAIDLGIVVEKSGEYTDVRSGKKLCDEGRAVEKVAAEYLANAAHQDVRFDIEARIKVAKE